MKAYVVRRYGGPNFLSLDDKPTPEPGPNDVLVRVLATSVNSGDVRVRAFDLPKGMRLIGRMALGWTGPRQPVLGTEFSGTIEAIGHLVTRFKIGDRVFGFPGGKMGAHAEHILVPEGGRIEHLPDSVSLEQGAALSFGGSTALHFLRQAELQSGESILVIGATGTVGHALVQLAQHQGARVSAVTSTNNVSLLDGLGLSRVLDYKTTPLSKLNLGFDVVADCANALDFKSAQRLLKPQGRYLAVAGTLKEMLRSLIPGPHGTKMIAGPAAERAEDLGLLAQLAAEGKFTPLIDSKFPFSQMPDAHVRAQSGQKRGTVVVTLPHPSAGSAPAQAPADPEYSPLSSAQGAA